MKKLYVGNLSFGTTNEDLTQLFSQFGEVASASVVTDRETGRSRGSGSSRCRASPRRRSPDQRGGLPGPHPDGQRGQAA
ncbi:MAG: hypothetical protein U0804_00580 [Gemmataceae bacterium]